MLQKNENANTRKIGQAERHKQMRSNLSGRGDENEKNCKRDHPIFILRTSKNETKYNNNNNNN